MAKEMPKCPIPGQSGQAITILQNGNQGKPMNSK